MGHAFEFEGVGQAVVGGEEGAMIGHEPGDAQVTITRGLFIKKTSLRVILSFYNKYSHKYFFSSYILQINSP